MLLGHCVEDIEDRLRKLDAATDANDGKQARALAHALKGLFAQFGAVQATQAAAETELSDENSLAENLRRLKQFATRALTKFETIRDAESPSGS